MHSRTSMLSLIILPVGCAVGLAGSDPTLPAWGEKAFTERGAINILDYRDRVVSPGSETEDWQPTFQAAITDAYASGRCCIRVPAGDYPIQQTIAIPPPPYRGFGFVALRIVGEGRNCTRISQQNETVNAIDWTGPAYKESVSGGTLEDISITGGVITLNIKWHNCFMMRRCYIAGGATGVYAEGWSSNFTDVIVRWCRKYGIHGRAHFNNITIRDGYMSRVGTGIYIQGGNGIRIHGFGIEGTTSTAIRLGGAKLVTITDCYFECDGMARSLKQGFEIEQGYPSSIYLAVGCRAVTIEGCTFRCTGKTGGHITIVECLRGSIRRNLFQLLHPNYGVSLRSFVYKGKERHRLQDVIVEGNFYRRAEMHLRAGLPEQPDIWYAYEDAAFLEAAKKAGCRFEGGDERFVKQLIEIPGTEQKHVAPQE